MDEGSKRKITVQKEGLTDAVVWNPWAEKAKGMADFADDEYQALARLTLLSFQLPLSILSCTQACVHVKACFRV